MVIPSILIQLLVRYESCWPSLIRGAHGVILVYNAENPKHDSELEGWVNQFPKKAGIPATSCVTFAHHLTGNAIKGQSKLRMEIQILYS